MFIGMLDVLSKNKGKYDISSLRSGFISGAGCPEVLMKRIINEMGIPEFTTGYGMTEASPIMFLCDVKDPFEKKSQTVGRIGNCVESKIINPETGKIVPWGEAGEVCVKGYLVMKGYWNEEEKSKEAID